MRLMRGSNRLFTFQRPTTVNPQSGELTPEQHPVIAGYRVGDVLGEGPLGKVYRAQHEQNGQWVVLRGFARPEGADPTEWEQAKNQFRDLLVLHQRIADLPDAPSTIQKVVGFGEENGLFWIATEYFEGITLRQLLDTDGPLPMIRVIEILRQVAQAVDWMGNQGLIHTDLNPFNILLVNAGNPPNAGTHIEVINFGLAHARSKFGSRYAAPEQMEGIEGDRRADVYAVGAMLHEMLTGKPLFSGETPEEISQRVLYSPPQIQIQRPAVAQKIVAAMVAKRPEWRYQTITEAINDFANNREPQFVVPEFPAPAPEIQVFIPEPIESVPVYTPDPPPARVERPLKPEIILQNYQLNNQDLIILRWRAEQELAQKEQEAEARRERVMPWVKRLAWVVVPCLLFVWAMGWRDGYRYLTVKRVSGNVSLRENGVNRPLKEGDQIRADAHPVIVTAAGGSVALAMPEGRLFLPQNSALGLLRLDYNGGAVRHLELFGGSVVGMLEKGQAIRRFDVRVGNALTRVKGQYFFLTFAQRALVAGAKQGKLVVEFDGEKHPVEEGNAVAISEGSSTPEAVPLTSFSGLTNYSEKSLNGVGTTGIPMVTGMAEKVASPLLTVGDTVMKLPVKANDQKAIGLSTVGMQSICTLLMTADSGDGLPANLDLKTLKELGMEEKDRQRILDLFEGKQLLSYRKLPNGGYEVYARSLDSDHTLMRGSNGHVEVLTNDEGPTTKE